MGSRPRASRRERAERRRRRRAADRPQLRLPGEGRAARLRGLRAARRSRRGSSASSAPCVDAVPEVPGHREDPRRRRGRVARRGARARGRAGRRRACSRSTAGRAPSALADEVDWSRIARAVAAVSHPGVRQRRHRDRTPISSACASETGGALRDGRPRRARRSVDLRGRPRVTRGRGRARSCVEYARPPRRDGPDARRRVGARQAALPSLDRRRSLRGRKTPRLGSASATATYCC